MATLVEHKNMARIENRRILTCVLDLSTGSWSEYSLLPKQAVAAAYAQIQKRDWSTWDYAKYLPLVLSASSSRAGKIVVSCGNQSVLCDEGQEETMAERLYISDARALAAGTFVLLSWYDGGQRTAPARLTQVAEDRIGVIAYPHGDKCRKVTLVETRDGRGMMDTRRNMEYVLKAPNPTELESCQRVFSREEGVEVENEELSLKEVAKRLVTAMSDGKPHGSKYLAKKAGVEFSPVIRQLMKKLRDAGIVKWVSTKEGKGAWARA